MKDLHLTSAKAVIVVGPAWYSCGTYQVLKSQTKALVDLGWTVYFLAVAPTISYIGEGDGWWDHYERMTTDFTDVARGEARIEDASEERWRYRLTKWGTRHRTQMYWRLLPARLAAIPASLTEFIRTHEVSAIVCNHYFNLPIAQRLKRRTRGAPIILETHDVQARHMIKTHPAHPFTDKPGKLEDYFRDEIRICSKADCLVHLNEDEFKIFQKELPRRRHYLNFPGFDLPPPAPDMPADIDFLIVASANLPNYESIRWFLDEVWDDEFNKKAVLRIVGNVDYQFSSINDPLLTRYGNIFTGRVEELSDWYHRTRNIVLPVVLGEGIAIKTVEALSYGRPLIYTDLAFRGFSTDVVIPERCPDAASMKAAIKARIESRDAGQACETTNRAALSLYERLFSPEVYKEKLRAIVEMASSGARKSIFG